MIMNIIMIVIAVTIIIIVIMITIIIISWGYIGIPQVESWAPGQLGIYGDFSRCILWPRGLVPPRDPPSRSLEEPQGTSRSLEEPRGSLEEASRNARASRKPRGASRSLEEASRSLEEAF